MTRWSNMPYPKQIQRRIRILWGVIVCMLIFMVVVGETGGDSRIMTRLAETMSRILYFGGLIFVGVRIAHNKKLLKDRLRMKEQAMEEQDERNRYLHQLSGGYVMDAMLLVLWAATLTASLYDMSAFHMGFGLLVTAVILKAGAYWLGSRKS